VHENAHINFPLLANDTLTGGAMLSKASPQAQEFFADPKNVTQNDVTRAITKVGDKIEKGIRQEAIISTVILLVWLILFLGGITVTFIRLKQREKLRGEAGHDYGVREITSVNLDQHLGPAPAYYTAQQDVNANAPYTLNSHPIPRQSSDSDDVIETEKRAPVNYQSAWTPNNQNQNTYNNEKATGFL